MLARHIALEVARNLQSHRTLEKLSGLRPEMTFEERKSLLALTRQALKKIEIEAGIRQSEIQALLARFA